MSMLRGGENDGLVNMLVSRNRLKEKQHTDEREEGQRCKCRGKRRERKWENSSLGVKLKGWGGMKADEDGGILGAETGL